MMRVPENLGKWFQNIKLPGGAETNPGVRTEITWRSIERLSSYFTGKTVLEIGCNGGYMMLRLEKEWNCIVNAFDISEMYVNQAKYIKQLFELKANVFKADISKDDFEKHQIVFMSGILYHLDDPIGVFRKALSLTEEYLILETAFCKGEESLFEFNVGKEQYESTLNPTMKALQNLFDYCGASVITTDVYDHNRATFLIKPRSKTERFPGMSKRDVILN